MSHEGPPGSLGEFGGAHGSPGSSSRHSPVSSPVIRTLLVTDLVDSARLVSQLGDERSAAVFARYDHLTRSLLSEYRGLEIDRTDGFLLMFERPLDATNFALAYLETLASSSEREEIGLSARVGIHLGEVVLRSNHDTDVLRGAKQLEVEGLTKITAARLASLAMGSQILLTRSALELARRAMEGEETPGRLSWISHGDYVFQGLDEPVTVFEVGVSGLAPLAPPPDSPKAQRARPHKLTGRKLTPRVSHLFLAYAQEDENLAKDAANVLRQTVRELRVALATEPHLGGSEEQVQGRVEALALYVAKGGAQYVDPQIRQALLRRSLETTFQVFVILGPGADLNALPPYLHCGPILDLREGMRHEATLKKVAAFFRAPLEGPSFLPQDEPPFRGLLAFHESHAHLFFGRDNETRELCARLKHNRFLAVVGDSGSGKSSLVRAGLIPTLSRGLRDGQKSLESPWRIAVARPGDRPFHELGNALLDLAKEISPEQRIDVRATLTRQLETGVDGLGHIISGLVPRGHPTLLVVDQFEELFNTTVDVEERRRFIDLLLRTTESSNERPIYIVVTLRADFYSRCWEHAELPSLMAQSQFVLNRMSRGQLLEVVEKPLAMAGTGLEPGLAELIVDDLGDEPGSLPLLEHALYRLWAGRSNGTLTHGSYLEMGRMPGALGYHADAVYQELKPQQQVVARRIFLDLVRPVEGGGNVRHRANMKAILGVEESSPRVRMVLTRLTEARLVTTGRRDPAGEEFVELAHEAITLGWQRFRSWLAQERDFLLWRDRLRESRSEWKRAGKESAALLRGARLMEAQKWATEQKAQLSPQELSFVEHSARRSRGLGYVRHLFMILVVALVIASVFFFQNARAERRKAEEIEHFVVDLVKLAEDAIARGEKQTAPEILERTEDRIEKGLIDSPRIKARLLQVIAEGYEKLGDYPKAETLLRRSLAAGLRLYGEASLEVAETRHYLGVVLWDQGRFHDAQAYYEAALETQQRVLGTKNPVVAQTLNDLGVLLYARALYPAAKELISDAYHMRCQLNVEPPFIRESLQNLADILNTYEEYESVEEIYREIISQMDDLPDKKPVEEAEVHYSFGVFLQEQGRFGEAEEHIQKSLQIHQEQSSPLHPLTLFRMQEVAKSLLEQGKHSEAVEHMRTVVSDLRAKLKVANHPLIATALDETGWVLWTLGEFQQAEDEFRAAWDIRKAILDNNHPDLALSMTNVGFMLILQRDCTGADPLLREARTTLQSSEAPHSAEKDHIKVLLAHCSGRGAVSPGQ